MEHTDIFIDKIEKSKEMGDYDGALKIALEGLNAHMNDYRFYEELADIYIFQNNLDKAEEVIRYARELHPTSGTGLFLEGYILSEKWDFENAIKTLEQANSLFPNNAEILRLIGWSYVMLGSMQKGIALLRRAKWLDSEDEKISHNLAVALMLAEEQNSSSLS